MATCRACRTSGPAPSDRASTEFFFRWRARPSFAFHGSCPPGRGRSRPRRAKARLQRRWPKFASSFGVLRVLTRHEEIELRPQARGLHLELYGLRADFRLVAARKEKIRDA